MDKLLLAKNILLFRRSGSVLDPKLPETASETDDPDLGPEDTDLDDESFRSDLERDSAHSSLVNQIQSRQYQQLSPQQQQVGQKETQ